MIVLSHPHDSLDGGGKDGQQEESQILEAVEE
jgi:hypothetical protein